MISGSRCFTLSQVDRSAALRELQAFHAVAIRLRDGGYVDHVIALALDLDDDQVPILLQLADNKLANLMSLDVIAPSR